MKKRNERTNPVQQTFASIQADIGGTPAELESDFGNGSLAAEEIQGTIGGKLLVRVTSVRTRLLDEDNLCEKYHVDLCRYAGILFKDSPGSVKIEATQRKAGKGEQEKIIIEIFQIC